MKNIIDLHSHSIYSLDGELKPEQLVDKAIEAGVKYYAISDHDEVAAIDGALAYAKDKDIKIIPAVEISAIIDNYPLHVLGYNIDYHNPEFKKRRQYINSVIIDFDKEVIRKTKEFGFYLDEEKLYKFRDDGLFCEEHIGEVVLADERNKDNPLLSEFKPGGKLSDNPPFNFYKEFFAPGKPINVPYNFNLDIEETAKLIKAGGGKMFLAHPYHNIKDNEEVLRKIMSYGLDGVEVFSSYHNEDGIKYYYDIAKKYNLYMSVGSDFHGRAKPAIKIGSIDYDEEQLNKTLKFLEVM